MARQICSCQKSCLWQAVCSDEKVQTFVQSVQMQKKERGGKVIFRKASSKVNYMKHGLKHTLSLFPLLRLLHPPSLQEIGEKSHVGLFIPFCSPGQVFHYADAA